MIFEDQEMIDQLMSLNGDTFLERFNTISDRYKIQIDQTSYLILGTGVSPEFVYPIYSFTNFIPNPVNQRIYYVNDYGYSRLREAFSTNPIETNIVGRFKDRNLSQAQRQLSLDKINQ